MHFGNYLIKTSYIHPPIPIRTMDWCAWPDGMEESLYEHGPTELDALVALHNAMIENGMIAGCHYLCSGLDCLCKIQKL